MRSAVVQLILSSTLLQYLQAEECPFNNKECEYTFVVDHKLTMMHQKDLVFSAHGQLYKFNVTNISSALPIPIGEVISADGWDQPRLVTVVNGQFPGPNIIVYEGQKVKVHVTNALRGQVLTIHWHGLHQIDTPWMDGVPWVTQCPIHPGQTFTYYFTAKPKGTFWWHSHMGGQLSMGVFGAFIIKDRKETIVEDQIMMIHDWNHDWDADTGHMKMIYGIYEGKTKWKTAKSLDGSSYSLFKIQSALINGRGRFHGSNSSSQSAPLTVFDVAHGNTYRFRVIGTGQLYPFRVSVDRHMLTVIASDGYELQPVVAESFIINPGERFDFEITTNQTIANYWIRGVSLEKDTPHLAEAILRYKGAPVEEPKTTRQECNKIVPCLVLNCPFTYYPENNTFCKTFDELKALANDDPAPPYYDGKFKEYFLNFAFPGITTFPGSVNGRTFDTPDVNPLTQPKQWHSPCEAPTCGEDVHCKCTHALEIGHGDTIQMVFLNMGRGKGWSHPIHMHGHSFYVVKMGYGQYNDATGNIIADNMDIDCRGNVNREQSFCNNATWTNATWLNGNVPDMELQHPPRKDTIIVPTGGYVVIRILANNPGIWNMHCHIELHNLDGMQMLINESFTEIPAAPRGFPECHSFRLNTYNMDTNTEANVQRLVEPTIMDKNSYISTNHYWTLLGLLITILVLQIVVIIGFCCIGTKSNSEKYTFGRSNKAFDERS